MDPYAPLWIPYGHLMDPYGPSMAPYGLPIGPLWPNIAPSYSPMVIKDLNDHLLDPFDPL